MAFWRPSLKFVMTLTLFFTWNELVRSQISVSSHEEYADQSRPLAPVANDLSSGSSLLDHKLRPERSIKNADRENKKSKSKRKEGRKRIAISLVEKIVEDKLKQQLDPLATALRIVRLDAFSEGILRQLTNMEHIQSQLLTEIGVLRAAVNEVGRHTLDLGRQVVGIDERLTALGRQLPHRLDLSGARSSFRSDNGVQSSNTFPNSNIITDALVSITTKLSATEQKFKEDLKFIVNRTSDVVKSSQSVLERRIAEVALDTDRIQVSVENIGNKSWCKQSAAAVSPSPAESFYGRPSMSPQKFGFSQATRDDLAYFPAENLSTRREERHYPPSITPFNSRTSSQSDLSSMSSSAISKLASEISKRINVNRDFPKDCFDIASKGEKRSGIYSIYPASCNRRFVVKVWCELDQSSGGWTVIQNRGSSPGSAGIPKAPVDFFKDWVDYKWGFGDLNNEYWLGNEYLHEITQSADYDLRIELQDWTPDARWAEYSHFIIDSETNNYTLHFGDYSGSAGNSLKHHQGIAFSTRDRDNDSNPKGHCARTFHGAWWFTSCHESHLNGQYHRGRHKSYGEGINWMSFRGHNYSLKKSRMMIRPSMRNT